MNMKFQVGDKVFLSSDSEWNDVYGSNPIHIEGVVDFIDESENLSVHVKWSNGASNAYRHNDLFSIIKEDTPSELEEAYARIDSLEELVSSLSDDRANLIKTSNNLLSVILDNRQYMDTTDWEAVAYSESIMKAVVKPELE
jgi:hypothetical protein